MTRSDLHTQSTDGIAVDGVAVGRVRRADQRRHEDRGQLRASLGRYLGLRASALAALADADVETALSRMSDLVDRLAELEARAVHDDLTGVLRRGPGLDALRLELARARRLSQPVSVAFVDVDGLKAINDTHGHAAGDTLLRTVAATMRCRLRSTDLIMRHGGDEFVCVLGGASMEAARGVMSEVTSAVVEATGGTSVSVGVATLAPREPSNGSRDPSGDSGEDSDAGALVAAADLDLYARRTARGRGAATSR